MINDFRKTIQKQLNNIEGLSSGKIISDEMIEENKYHFGYIITQNNTGTNVDYSNYKIIYNITGYLTTKGGTLKDFDNYADAIVNELSKLRFITNCNDITTSDNTRRMSITGTVIYDTLDKLLK